MSSTIAFIQSHQVIFTLAGGYIWSAFISALPAPTAESGAGYKFLFSFANYLAANISRAKNTAVEQSPNFQAAVDKQTDMAGQPQINVILPKGDPNAPKP